MNIYPMDRYENYPKSDATPWLEKTSTSRACQAHDTRFYWLGENALYRWVVAWSLNGNAADHRSALKKKKKRKTLSVCVWIQLICSKSPLRLLQKLLAEALLSVRVVTKSPSTVLLIWAHGWGCCFTGNMKSGVSFLNLWIIQRIILHYTNAIL